MAAGSLFLLGVTVVCGVLAFGEGARGGVAVHLGFLVGLVGLVSLCVAMLAKWAANTLDDVPGQRSGPSR